jgi:hypothetical protein
VLLNTTASDCSTYRFVSCGNYVYLIVSKIVEISSTSTISTSKLDEYKGLQQQLQSLNNTISDDMASLDQMREQLISGMIFFIDNPQVYIRKKLSGNTNLKKSALIFFFSYIPTSKSILKSIFVMNFDLWNYYLRRKRDCCCFRDVLIYLNFCRIYNSRKCWRRKRIRKIFIK